MGGACPKTRYPRSPRLTPRADSDDCHIAIHWFGHKRWMSLCAWWSSTSFSTCSVLGTHRGPRRSWAPCHMDTFVETGDVGLQGGKSRYSCWVQLFKWLPCKTIILFIEFQGSEPLVNQGWQLQEKRLYFKLRIIWKVDWIVTRQGPEQITFQSPFPDILRLWSNSHLFLEYNPF